MSQTILAELAANGNTTAEDVRLVLTRSGLVVECRRCGRVLAVDAVPASTSPKEATR